MSTVSKRDLPAYSRYVDNNGLWVGLRTQNEPVDENPASPGSPTLTRAGYYTGGGNFHDKFEGFHSTAIMPTGSPRLFASGTSAKPGSSSASDAAKDASAERSARVEPSADLRPKAV